MNAEQAWSEVAIKYKQLAVEIGLGLSSRLSPINICATLAIFVAIYLWRKPSIGFGAWAFPARIYRSSGFRIDFKFFLLNFILASLLAALFAGGASSIANAVVYVLGGAKSGALSSHPYIIAILLLISSDFAAYWVHRLHHRLPILWSIHALHHSAEDLSPVSVFRHHPIFQIVDFLIATTFLGLTQGLILTAFGSIDGALLLNTNLFIAAFNLLGSNLRHSHIWLRYPRIVEFILISPAQHQVHHSIEPRHYDRNFGEILAIWDWMFGSLYVPKDREDIQFGLGDGQGNRVPQRHVSFRTALSVPIWDALNKFRKG